ncbi:MAG: GAF domain-containing protein, partial [Pseudanabaena sp. ELA607]
MIPADPLPNEQERYAELLRYEILDTEAESDFDDIVKLASLLCKSEISLISLIDDHRQWFKAKTGLNATETPKELAFCAHAIHQDDLFEIPDASQDERFHDNPLVTGEPNIRFYAGQPLNSAQGYKLGTLCIIGRQPRQLGDKERYILKILGRQV